MGIAMLFMLVVSLVGPAPKGTPAELQLKAGQTIVAIGDSITAAGGYLRMSDTFLAEHYPDLKIPKIINAGVGGQKAEDLVKRFQRDVVDKNPAVVTISVGINDVWQRLGAPHDEKILAAYKQNIITMVDMAQRAGIKVVLLTPTVIQEDPDAEGNRRLSMYVEVEKQIALEKSCQLVDLHQMFLTALKQKPADGNQHWLTVDGVHMQPLGDAIMAVGVLRALGVSFAVLDAGFPPLREGAIPGMKVRCNARTLLCNDVVLLPRRVHARGRPLGGANDIGAVGRLRAGSGPLGARARARGAERTDAWPLS